MIETKGASIATQRKGDPKIIPDKRGIGDDPCHKAGHGQAAAHIVEHALHMRAQTGIKRDAVKTRNAGTEKRIGHGMPHTGVRKRH